MSTVSPFTRTSPEEQGIPSSAIIAFIDDLEREELGAHSFMLVRHAAVVAERWWCPYQPTDPHVLYSLSKSFTSTAAGLAIDEGLFSLDDRVVSFFPNDLPEAVGENLAKMRIRDLLTMSSGHMADAIPQNKRDDEQNWVRVFFSEPIFFEPGTHFAYNSGATYMVSAILQAVTGQRMTDYLRPRLFEPLGIENPTWERCPRGIDVGGWGLNATTEDIAKFGQMYLQKGVWQGKPIVPESWIEMATSLQISNGGDAKSDWNQGYGFQFWRCKHGAYRGDGAFGQFCVVMPDQDAVVAMTSGTPDMQRIVDLIWKHLLPGMGAERLPADEAAEDALLARPSTLAFRMPVGESTSPTALRVSGRTYAFPENDDHLQSIALRFDDTGTQIRYKNLAGEHLVEVVPLEWRPGETKIGPPQSPKYVSYGVWLDAATYEVTLCFYETPYVYKHIFHFDGDQLTFEWRKNVSFGPTERSLTGKAA